MILRIERRYLGKAAALALAISALLPCAPGATAAEPESKPLWEVDALGFAAYTPDYPGSEQSHLHFLPLPWITYRGSFLRTDERGIVRGQFIDTKRFGLDVSARASFPSHSGDNDARAGMPDLDWMGEVGPRARLGLYFWENAATGRKASVGVELPVRAVLTTDFHSTLDYRGVVANPALYYENNRLFSAGPSLKVALGPIFASDELMDYFYGVKPAEATAARPAYTASAGFLGTRWHMSARQAAGERLSFLGRVDLDSLHGSANEDSPLMKEKFNAGIMLGISVALWQSSTPAAKYNAGQ